MCAGAIVLSRIQKVYIGSMDPKAGACGSLYNLLQDPRLNHQTELETGILEDACTQIMKSFFKELRARKKRRVDTTTP